MSDIVSLLSNPVVWKVLIAYWIISAFIGALPTPREGSSLYYQFAFRFAHILAGNLNRAAVKLKVPGADESAAPAETANDKP